MAKTVLLTGGTGLIGKKITQQLVALGYQVHILTRGEQADEEKVKYFQWDLKNKHVEEAAFDGVDSVIHLVGASVAKRWTKDYKKAIISTRVDSTDLIHQKLKQRKQQIKAFVSASASGYYPANTGEIMKEEAASGNNFLAEVCKQWEAAAQQFSDVAERVVINRIGVVMAKEGGALEKMVPPFRFGIAPYFGKGNQYYPWVHIEDVANQFAFGVTNEIEGIFNANTGNITQCQLNREIANALDKKVIEIPAPIAALKIAMGEMHQIVTDSIQMSNQKIRTAGFTPSYPEISNALGDLFD